MKAEESTRIRDVGLLAVASATLLGLAEAALVLHHREVLGRLTRVSPDFVWMATLADLGFFLTLGSLLYLLGRVWRPAARWSTAVCAFAFVGALGVALVLPWKLHIAAAALLATGVAAHARRLAARRPRGLLRGLVWSTLGFASILGALAGWIAGREVLAERRALRDLPPPPAGSPNILLIILDTVRADHLGLYGYERATTPNLDSLAARGTVFDKAIAPAPWTLPSHASMLTGRRPTELSTDWERPLDGTHPTLAEVLSRHGYVTSGFVANLLYTSRWFGLARGFAHYDDYPRSIGQTVLSSSLGRELARRGILHRLTGSDDVLNRKRARRVTDDFLSWLDRRDRRPYFAFLNYFDAHEPYLPPAPYDEKFGASGPRPLERTGGLRHDARAWRPRKWESSNREIRLDRNAYDGAIAYIDANLGRLVRELEARGELDETVILVTSDHGEHLGEHGLFGHLNSLYSPLLRVPLVVMGPGIPHRRVEAVAGLRHLAATVADLAGVRDSPLGGRSLARMWSPSTGPDTMAAFSTVRRGLALRPWYPIARGPGMHSLYRASYHYICNGDGSEELYRVDVDAVEVENLAPVPAVVPTLRALRETLHRLTDEEPSCLEVAGRPAGAAGSPLALEEGARGVR